jgi:hypothetical protein
MNCIKQLTRHDKYEISKTVDARRVDVQTEELILLTMGSLLCKQQLLINSLNINDYEFKIFSQWGDDGIIQFLIRNVVIENEIFIEFGVENYQESNTRFLLMNNNWKGWVMDGSEDNIQFIRNSYYYWKYELTAKDVFITKENVNGLISETKLENIGLLHIDIDGNDYFILEELDLNLINPSIIIMEYNADLGYDRRLSIPYSSDFNRTVSHFSNLYFGASLAALVYVASKKGYVLIGCDISGTNAYFVRRDLLNDKVIESTIIDAYKPCKFRQSRNADGELSFLNAQQRLELLKGMPFLEVETREILLL